MTQKLHKSSSPLELRLEVDQREDGASRLRDVLRADGPEAPMTQRLRTIYFDTPTRDLRANHISLRVRQVGGSWRQTLKAEPQIKGGLSDPIEVEGDVDGPAPDLRAIADKKLRRRLRGIIANNPLERIFETDVRRTTQTVSHARGNQVEIAFDDAAIKSSTDTEEFIELELKLRRGRPNGLMEVVNLLTQNNVQFRPVSFSKAERGYRLLLKQGNAELSPKKLKQSRLRSAQTTPEAFQALLSSTVKQVLHNWSVVLEGSDPEGPHQLRVGVRFLRTLIRAFRPVIDSKELRALERDLQELGRIIGDLRDLDVLYLEIVGDLDRPAALAAGFNKLDEDLSAYRERQRAAVRHTLCSQRMRNLQITLALLPNHLGWEHIASEERLAKKNTRMIARKALDKSWRLTRTLGKRIEELSIEERHRLRKKLKGLRYTLEAFSPIYGKKKCQRFIRDLKRLQGILGYLNDATLAEQLYDRTGRSRDPAFQQAIGYVVGYHAANSTTTWHQAKRYWAALLADDRPWS